MGVDKELEALFIRKLKNEYSEYNLQQVVAEALASATIAKKREDIKEKKLDEWYDQVIADLDQNSLSFADAGIIAALAYNERHPDAELVKLTQLQNLVTSYAAGLYEGDKYPVKPIGKTWEITLQRNDDPVKQFLIKNQLL